MAMTLTITVTDAQANRALIAYGHLAADRVTWTPATGAEMQGFIKAWVKSHVIDYETSQAALADRNTRSAEVW